MNEISDIEMLDVIKAKVAESSQAELARELGISSAYMSDIIKGRRLISAQVAKTLGYELKIVYQRIYAKHPH